MTELVADNYKTLTFDCYGTLVDWENGILGYLQPLLEIYDVHVLNEWILEFFAECEPRIEAGGGSYRSVLGRVLEQFGKRLAFVPNEEALNGFANSIEYWQPFPDTVPALRALAKQFRLAVISNIDNDLFAYSAQYLGVEFGHVITAQDVGVYKPSKEIFEAALAQVKGPVLHVAQSRYYDIVPATELGLDTVWIDRHDTGYEGAVKGVPAKPTWTFKTLEEFTDALNLD
jgi:2-haloacid dehalogenase